MRLVEFTSNRGWNFSRGTLAFCAIIFWFLAAKEFMEVAEVFNYYFYFFPLVIMGVFFFIELVRWLQIGASLEKYQLSFYFLFFIFLANDLLRGDYEGLLEQLKFFLGFMFIYSFSKKFPLHEYNLKFITIFFFFSSVIYAWLSPRHDLIFVPEQVNNYRAYIAAAHYSGKMYIFILLAMLYIAYMRFDYKHHFRISEKFIILALFILTVMAGARSTIHIFIVIMFLFLFYRNKKIGLGAIIFPVFFLATIYLLPVMLESIVAQGYWATVLKITEVNDVSAGRGWLQLFHLSLFENNWLFGVPAEVVDFKIGEIVNGQPAVAASESMYTKNLAREGLFGIIKILIFLFFIIYSVFKNNLPAFLVSASILILNASISILSNSYSIFGILYMWLYFSTINQESLMLKLGKIQK